MKLSRPTRQMLRALRMGDRRGFTLVELMVVVALIAVLSAILLSALAKARTRAHAIFCLNNTRQLTLAWQNYAYDHDDKLVYNLGGDASRLTVAKKSSLNWVNNVLTWGLESDNIDKTTISKAALGGYTDSPEVYRCPADNVLDTAQKKAGWDHRIRSYSMNAMVGDAGEYSANGVNINNRGYQQFFKSTLILDPSEIFVFMEEHPDSIDDGYFINTAYAAQLQWSSLPASYHNGAAAISFADGHSELHKWIYDSTRKPARPHAAGLTFSVLKTELLDFNWVVKHMSVSTSARSSSLIAE